MKQNLFEQRHQREWLAFSNSLEALENNQASATESRSFSSAYRRICLHLALAQERNYSPLLIDQLRALVLRGHQQFYRHHSSFSQSFLSFIFGGFAQAVRQQWRYVLAASLLFFGSLLLMAVLCFINPELIYSLLEPSNISSIERMYDPTARDTDKTGMREAGSDWTMFGYYIMNNIGIGFQTFASGLLFGLGTLFFLLFNGLYIGAVTGHLTRLGYNETFWSFVIGHGAFELTAIALAGATGLKIGWALIAPKQLRRLTSLRLAAQEVMPVVFGMFLFFFIAAFIEAYWSSITFASPAIKYWVGAGLWLLVFAYFIFAGRQHAPN